MQGAGRQPGHVPPMAEGIRWGRRREGTGVKVAEGGEIPVEATSGRLVVGQPGVEGVGGGKMVGPVREREAVGHLQRSLEMSAGPARWWHSRGAPNGTRLTRPMRKADCGRSFGRSVGFARGRDAGYQPGACARVAGGSTTSGCSVCGARRDLRSRGKAGSGRN